MYLKFFKKMFTKKFYWYLFHPYTASNVWLGNGFKMRLHYNRAGFDIYFNSKQYFISWRNLQDYIIEG